MNPRKWLGVGVQAARYALNRAAAVRYLRNCIRYPGLGMDPSVNCRVDGLFEYGMGSAISEGANLIVPAGAILRLGAQCHVGRHVELGPLNLIEIGERTSLQDRTILVGDISLGNYCVLSLNVLMSSGTHYYDRWPHLLIRDQDSLVSGDGKLFAGHSRLIRVGEDCWFGMNAAVMPGVSIGRGCVVGTNAVVTHDVPPYTVVGGVPARVIKRRLAFEPPRHIDWRALDQLPYFYAGFEVAGDQRQRNEHLGGHLARRDFSLWLGRPASQLNLRVRCAAESSVTLSASGVTATVDDQWSECHLPVSNPEGPIEISVSPGNRGVVLSEAWVV